MSGILRSLFGRVPAIGRLVGGGKKRKFTNSSEYWERRYRRGRDSGAGSFGRLAEFKAQIINDFVRDQGVRSVLELGCGDGNQLLLAEYGTYVGCDVSAAAIDICRERFKDDPTKEFRLIGGDVSAEDPAPLQADLALSLDVIYHLVEDDVYERYLGDLFHSATRFVMIYSSDDEKDSVDPHIKYRKFTDFVAARFKDWELMEFVKNKYPYEEFGPTEGSISDFYVYRKTEVLSDDV